MTQQIKSRLWFAPLAIALFCAGFMSLREHNGAIAMLALLLSIGGVLVTCYISQRDSNALLLFAWALLLRAALSYSLFLYYDDIASWGVIATDAQTWYNSGFSDSYAVSYQGFRYVNQWITSLAAAIDAPHYLANVQVQLVAGALVPACVYVLGKRFVSPQVGALAGWIIVFHMGLISISVSLLRDSVVAALGLLFLIEITHPRYVWLKLPAVGGLLAALWAVRAPSAGYFTGIAGIYFLIRFGVRLSRRGRIALGFAIVIGLTAGVLFRDNMLGIFVSPETVQYSSQLRMQSTNQDSIVAQLRALLGRNSVWIEALIYFVAPFPFDAVLASPRSGGADVLMAAGGLTNQLLFGFVFAGAVYAVRTRAYFLYVCVIGPALFAIYSTLASGDQARYMASHGFPLLALVIANIVYANRKAIALGLSEWGMAVFCMYIAYGIAKSGGVAGSGIGLVVMVGAAAAFAVVFFAGQRGIRLRLHGNAPLAAGARCMR